MPRLFAIHVTADGPFDLMGLKFEPKSALPADVVTKALELRREIDETNATIYQILSSMRQLNRYEAFSQELVLAAEAGLDSDFPDMLVGWYAVDKVKRDFVRIIGSEYRMRFVKKLLVLLVPVSMISLLMGTILEIRGSMINIIPNELLPRIQAICYVLFGVSTSVWLSSVLRNRTLTWSNLLLFDPDGLPAYVRLFLVCGVAYVFCVLLHLKIITIGIGDRTLNEYLIYPTVASLVGLIAGLSEDTLTKLVVGRLGNLVESGSNRSATPAPRPSGAA